jgi:hypothetical protein
MLPFLLSYPFLLVALLRCGAGIANRAGSAGLVLRGLDGKIGNGFAIVDQESYEISSSVKAVW